MSTPPDAGMSLLGTYGLRNPTMVWLLNRRPDLLAETPKELTWEPRGAPDCDDPRRPYDAPSEEEVEVADEMGCDPEDVHVFAFYPPCGLRMIFRYVHNRPAWVCFAHSGDDDSYPYYYRFIERPTPKMQTVPEFDLFGAIKASLDGALFDLRWDDRVGEWAVQETRR